MAHLIFRSHLHHGQLLSVCVVYICVGVCMEVCACVSANVHVCVGLSVWLCTI